ncbi:DUF4253 domain-containing protein [Streptomyces sp. NPDC090108]|uniref:DUF4253 domain-containing protein n=1 Tax=Streptomyces sp. NPDC090108 TaxID=3365947 RepID=UPI003810113B
MATLPNPLPRLATDPSGRSLGLRLPPGTVPDLSDGATRREPLLWQADAVTAPGGWTALGAPAARVGLLPVLLDTGGTQGGPLTWDLTPERMSYPGDHDAGEVLEEHWGFDDPDEEPDDELLEELLPFGPLWPGLAPAGALTADPAEQASRTADELVSASSGWFREPHLALVPARRSADIPAAIGWGGPLNHDNDVARLCAVLRSWEDRFGVRVVGLGFDIMTVSVAAPPATLAEAEAVAAEHFAFCPDNVTQNGTGGLRGYAETLVGATSWSFWWD